MMDIGYVCVYFIYAMLFMCYIFSNIADGKGLSLVRMQISLVLVLLSRNLAKSAIFGALIFEKWC